MVYYNDGDREEALRWMEKSRKIYEKVVGDNHTDTASIYASLGTIYRENLETDKSLLYYLNALEIYSDKSRLAVEEVKSLRKYFEL
jgi:tetratricopeptide (TPR) repeat protein